MPLEFFLLLAAALFCIGIYGLVTSRNAVRVLMSVELLLNAVNLNLVSFSNFLDGDLINGQVFTVFVITVAAAEAAVVWRLFCRFIATAIRWIWNSLIC